MLFYKVEFYEGVNVLICCVCWWILIFYVVYLSDKIDFFNNYRFLVLLWFSWYNICSIFINFEDLVIFWGGVKCCLCVNDVLVCVLLIRLLMI